MDLGPLNDIYNRVYLFVQSILLNDDVKQKIENVVQENLQSKTRPPSAKELRDFKIAIIKKYHSISHTIPSLERINKAIDMLRENKQNDLWEATYITTETKKLLKNQEIIELAEEIENDLKRNPTLEEFCSLLLSYQVRIQEIAKKIYKYPGGDETQEITFAICLLQKNSKFKQKLQKFNQQLETAQTKKPTLEILKRENEDELALVLSLFTKFIANFELIENRKNT